MLSSPGHMASAGWQVLWVVSDITLPAEDLRQTTQLISEMKSEPEKSHPCSLTAVAYKSALA